MHFQDLIASVQRYWGSLGCVLLQPHDMQMGAGTFHPATVLRSLGPNPWRCAYVQPSRRPSDARYGDNPNRLGHYYQFQVILKPSPSDVLDLYLGSLQAMGIDTRRCDIRFVEDDWESPTLGAWGLGWEVWMDGLEITQFTYFQQVGGISCAPVPAEITYGLERLAMALQGVDSVYDLSWVRGVKYGDVFHRNEVEQSAYNFEHADTDGLFEVFSRYASECRRLAELGLALPAYDHCIATSHAFNVLDARGAISVAERQQYIRRIRELACLSAKAWVDGTEPSKAPPAADVGPTLSPPPPRDAHAPKDELLVEVFCEELPASYVRPALEGLRTGVLGLLDGIEHGAARTYATPRRLAVVVEGVAEGRPKVEKLVTGPSADRAFADGVPTRAALGFARGKGVDPSDLQIVDGPKGKVVAARIVEGGESTAALVGAGLEAVVLGLSFPKSMEWGAGGTRWARPIHGVAAVFGGAQVLGSVAGLPLRAHTDGHRLAPQTTFAFASAAGWLEGLRTRKVEPDLERRRACIADLLQDLRTQGFDDRFDDDLVEEVTHLVEWPVLVRGTFDAALLELPPRLLVETMQHHQRYFPLFRHDVLTNHFAVISNNPWGNAEAIAQGNARVLHARFDDARFFLAEDRKTRLEAGLDDLQRMRWIRGLGTMAAKQARVSALARVLARRTGAAPELAARAGDLSKCDLVTQMVGEFPELQGHMGRLYAEAQGEAEAVALAIEEQYLPRSAADDVASSPVGIAVALADRLDTLAGCFGIGLKPKGGDPQGLRRAALGVVLLLVRNGLRTDLRALFADAVAGLHSAVVASPEGFEAWTKARGSGPEAAYADSVVGELVDFTLARFRAWAASEGVSADLVDAAVSGAALDVVALHARVEALAALSGNADFAEVMKTFKRVLNITKGHDFPMPAPEVLQVDAERALFEAVARVRAEVEEATEALDFSRALQALLPLWQPVADLFDAVMVDAEDSDVRAARLGLLLGVAGLFRGIADFGKVSTR